MSNQRRIVQGRVIDDLVTSHNATAASVNETQVCVSCRRVCKRNATKYCSVECYRDAQRSPSMVDRFWSKVNKTDGCWLWTGATLGRPTHKYGQFTTQAAPGKQAHHYAHRVSWALAHGSVPDDMSVCHHCDVTLCVRPDHLFLGTQIDNMRDASAKGRLHVQRPRRQIVTDAQVEEMIGLVQAGQKQCDVATQYGVSQTFVSLLLKGKRRQLRQSTPIEKVA